MAGALAAFLPFAAHALGLGKLTMRSALNEPLNAEVAIASISDTELRGLEVGLAPRTDFDQAGVERLPFHSQIKFNVSQRGDGSYFIQLRTDGQIVEPFLHILIAVEWPGGRMVREYTALIDPPTYVSGSPSGIEVPATESEPVSVVTPAIEQSPPAPIAIEAEPVSPPAEQVAPPEASPEQAAAVEPAPEPVAVAPIEETPEPAPSAAVEPLEAPAAKATTPLSEASVAAGWRMQGGYHVKWGDTAWRIAETLRVDDRHTIEQIVLALYRVNPQAFFGNNVNNLKAGKILKIPEASDIDAVAAVAARTEFRAHYDAWQEYKMKLAGASESIKVVEGGAEAPATAEPETAEAAKAKPAEMPVKETPAAAKTPAAPKKDESTKAPAAKAAQKDELLKIVRSAPQGQQTTPDKKPAEGEAGTGDSATEQQSLADRVATLEESLASKEMETKEIGDKVAQVREQLKREARLIKIEQQELAAAQEKAKSPAEKPAAQAEPVPAPKAEAPKPEEKVAAAPTKAPEPKAQAPATPPAPKKKVAPPPPPPPETSLIDDLIGGVTGGDNLPILVGALVVLLSVGIGFTYWNRRRKSIAEFEESILQSEGISSTGEPGVTTDTSGQVVSTGDTSFLSDFSQGGMGNIHTDEVDPIAEAEVYLAYGRDETAEEILKEAMVKNPAREEVRLKLLEIYANRSDVRAFETLAEEMYASVGGRPSPNWARVEELGRKLNPSNPMFQGGAAAAFAAAAAPSFADTAKMTMPPGGTEVAAPPPAEPVPADGGIDFHFNAGGETTAVASTDQGLDFDMGSGETTEPKEEESLQFDAELGAGSDTSGEVDVGKPTDNLVDFDFGEKEEAAHAAAPETEAAFDSDVAVMESSSAGAEAGSGETGESPQWDETATKLDLARAYIDMGDAEGARSILDEVMSEGNDQQKQQAQELAAQIG